LNPSLLSWTAAYDVASNIRQALAAGPILGGCLEALGEMGAHAEGLAACRGQLQLCLAAAVKALGPEQVLAVLPLHLEEGINAEIQVKTAQGGEVTDSKH